MELDSSGLVAARDRFVEVALHKSVQVVVLHRLVQVGVLHSCVPVEVLHRSVQEVQVVQDTSAEAKHMLSDTARLT